jgi:hypothetical protein
MVLSENKEGLPQELGALDIADTDPKLAQAGFETAELIQTAQPAPAGRQSSYRKKPKELDIQAQAAQMAAEGRHPREIGAFVASRTGFEQ